LHGVVLLGWLLSHHVLLESPVHCIDLQNQTALSGCGESECTITLVQLQEDLSFLFGSNDSKERSAHQL